MASGKFDEMSSAALPDEKLREWTGWLESQRARREATTIPFARRSVARDVGVAPGRFERIRAGRVKGVSQWFFERVRALVIREIESEIRRLTHELEIARQSGCDPRALDMGEVETHLAALRRIIKGEA